MHKGVGLIITNKSKAQFFIQQKDENYPIKKWAMCFSFWGGEIEETDDSLLRALKRELVEEIEDVINFESLTINFVDEFKINCDEAFVFTLFELILDNEQLHQLQEAKIFEGYGKLVSLDELKNGKWIWCLEHVIAQYIA